MGYHGNYKTDNVRKSLALQWNREDQSRSRPRNKTKLKRAERQRKKQERRQRNSKRRQQHAQSIEKWTQRDEELYTKAVLDVFWLATFVLTTMAATAFVVYVITK